MKESQTNTAGKNDTKRNNQNGKLHIVIASAMMSLLVIAILLTSFQLAIYGDDEYGFYKKEYEKYTVTEALDMEIDDVMEVTEYMMDYLIGREDVLSIETDVDGEHQDFFNEQDRLHMADVRNLFLGGLKLRNILAVAAVLLLVLLWLMKADIKTLLFRAYGIAMAVFGAVLLFLGAAFTVDFTKCFTIFHKMFFTNDLWIFDPETDYMIRMLPEGFFSDFVVRIVSVFVGSLAALGVLIFLLKKNRRGRSEESGVC